MNKGWISISRKLQDCFIWQDKPYAKGQAWIDMLLLANHADKKFMSKNEVVDVNRGSFLTSDQLLADRWGWGRKKTRLFLTMLENELMIETKRNSKGTIINIVNYDVYQTSNIDDGTTKEQQRNSKGTTEEQQRNTNNNVNNDNNVNNKKSSNFVPPKLEEIKEYCKERNNKVDAQKLYDFYSSKDWMIGKNKMKDWKAAVRTWEKRENERKPVQQQKQTTNKFNNFPQREYSEKEYSNLEKRLLNRG